MNKQEIIAAGYPVPDQGGRRTRKSLVLSEIKKRVIKDALDKTNGNRRKASELLGISERTLYRLLTKWQSLPPKFEGA